MTDLALIRARDAAMDKPGEQEFAAIAFIDRRALLALVDELQRERDELKDGTSAQVWFHLQMENGQLKTDLAAIRTALHEAGPAIEAGVALCMQRVLVTAQLTSVSETMEWSDHASQLRALMELAK